MYLLNSSFDLIIIYGFAGSKSKSRRTEYKIRSMMAGKIHRATVTQANVCYEGSITIDPDLMDAAGILQYELVQVLDITNGARLETYAIEGTRGSGEVCVNGAAGLLVRDRDLVIILHFLQMILLCFVKI